MPLSNFKKVISILLLTFSIIACTNPNTAVSTDMKPPTITLEEYLTKQNIQDTIKTKEGMYIQIENEGSEEKPTLNSKITINYKGYLLDHTVFDETDGDPRTFSLNKLISGWKIGIPYIGKGGKCKLIIPPHIGYGPNDSGPIPGNSVLVFDIELVDFN